MKPLTRNQAIELCGLEAVGRVERANADFSGRELEDVVEFAASVPCGDDTLTAYYYQDRRDVDAVENLDELRWEILHYSVM